MAPGDDQIKYRNKLESAHVLLIGGSSGLGFGVAEACLEYGAGRVTISSSQQQRVDDAVARLEAAYPSAKGKVAGYACDLSHDESLEEQVKLLFERATQHGSLDLHHVVFTAGDPVAPVSLSELDVTTIRARGTVRFVAPLIVAKYAMRYLHRDENRLTASLTLTTGSTAKKPTPNWAAVVGYAAGLHGITRGLALDMRPIRVNCISPGPVDTEMWSPLSPDLREHLAGVMAGQMLTGRFGRPEDAIELYLAAMRDANMTGQTLGTDGGHGLA